MLMGYHLKEKLMFSKDLNHDFRVAVMNHDRNAMNSLLKQKVDINENGLCLGRTALHIAVIMAISNRDEESKEERLAVLRMLVFSPEIKLKADSQGLTPNQYKGVDKLETLYPNGGKEIYDKLIALDQNHKSSDNDDDDHYYSYQALDTAQTQNSIFTYNNFSTNIFENNTTSNTQQINDDDHNLGLYYGSR
jgi:hypothetical protein